MNTEKTRNRLIIIFIFQTHNDHFFLITADHHPLGEGHDTHDGIRLTVFPAPQSTMGKTQNGQYLDNLITYKAEIWYFQPLSQPW